MTPAAAREAAELRGVVQAVRSGPRAGRNDPCPCGSGKKYKKCHMPIDEGAETERERPPAVSGPALAAGRRGFELGAARRTDAKPEEPAAEGRRSRRRGDRAGSLGETPPGEERRRRPAAHRARGEEARRAPREAEEAEAGARRRATGGNLVIVESPAKSRTLSKFPGRASP